VNKHEGTLYICPTPIGNLEDITLRALKILKQVDIIAAEDTRVTLKLLNHYDIKTQLFSYHEHNKIIKGRELIQLLMQGKSIALVSDAGMPGISDPGEELIKDAIKQGIKIVPLPGATASISALVASGLDCSRFVFEGFLPKKKNERQKRLAQLKHEFRTLILYEAPHRIVKTLEDIRHILGDRRIVVAREITKIHEQFLRATIGEVLTILKESKPRGEFVLVIEGCEQSCGVEQLEALQDQAVQSEGVAGTTPNNTDIQDLKEKLHISLKKYELLDISRKDALKKAAKDLGISRNYAYDILLQEKKTQRSGKTDCLNNK
jgi:16S rRNA (cytidine1402-2'-O)-methyltransferase